MTSNYQPLPTNSDSTEDLHLHQHRPPYPPHLKEPRRPLKKRYLGLVALGFLLTAIIFFKAGQYSARVPTEPSPTPSSPAQSTISTTTPSKPKPTSLPGNDTMYGGKKSVGYFVNWGIYGRKYMPTYIPANDLTHILYAFANINPSSGTVSLSDVWADKDIHYPGDSWNTPAGENHLFGNFKAIYLLKKKHRHLKLLLSIGGWTYSPSIHPVVVDPAKRAEFVKSSVALLDDYGLDGLDVDYEYPQNAEQARGYVDLLRELREALDQRERENGEGCKFLLTIAAPCGPDNYKKLLVAEMDQYLDFWNLMAYDYSGSWDRTANHQANLLGPPINTHEALEFYVSGGVASHKLVMGIPLYGRSFTQTDGPGHAFVGIGEGTWERGVYDYRTLPLPLDTTFTYNDEDLGASWTYDKTTREMISFDTPEIARLKGQFIRDNGLGGSMFWELSGDKMPAETEEERRNRDERDGKMKEGGNMGVGKQVIPGESLVRVVKEAMTGHGSRSLEGMDTSPNWLHYPRSQFDNLRQGMPDA